jgi:ATP-dependent helicase/nuclease subunit A
MSSSPFELGHFMVRAGAGAGKTTGLVRKVAEVYQLYRQHGRIPRIVLTTFTRKATQELKERLIQKACDDRDPDFLQFVSDPSCLHISTIHGLLNVFLRQVGHLAGLDAGFQILDEGESSRMARLALREVVIEHPEGLRFFEAYGFQRTLEMCRRFAQAWGEQGELRAATLEDLDAALASEVVIWRNKLDELASAILEEVEESSWRSFASALKSFLVTWTGDASQLESRPTKPRRSKKQAEYAAWHDRADEILKAFVKDMGRDCWRRSFWPKMIEEWNGLAALGRAFVARVNGLKSSQARFDMGDLEMKALEILRDKPFLGEIFAENWDFWMVDEFQDTSPLQISVLKALIGQKPRYYVGDPQQSIYLFRGAEVGVFHATEKELTGAGGNLLELRRNWRSKPDLLLWINDFITDLSPAFLAMEPREQPAGEPVRHCVTMIRAADDKSELEAAVARVGELVAAGTRFEQICVLGRTHRNLVEVSAALRAHGYPTHVHASRGFSRRREIVDALALWKFMINPHDNENLVQLLRSPWFYVADAVIADWMASKPPSLWRALQDRKSEIHVGLQKLSAARALIAPLGVIRAFTETLVAAGYLDLCLLNDPAGRKESNLWKLLDKARRLEREGGASLLDLMDAESLGEALEANEGDAASAQEPNCISLMTIHGAKGLEFDHVLIPRMGEGPRVSVTPVLQAADGRFSFPVRDEETHEFVAGPLDHLGVRRQQAREREEFDRWLYVALTRAKESLTLLWNSPDRDSWVARSRWLGREAGEYVSGSYRERICDGYSEPKPYLKSDRVVESVRSPWQSVTAPLKEKHSVTELLGTETIVAPVDDLLQRWEAQCRGTRIHKVMEALKYRGEWSGAADASVAYVTSIEDPPMTELIHKGFSEWGFQVLTQKGVIEGQIDLWAKHEGRLYIIDYKSGSTVFKESAFRQLELYAWALRRFGHHEPIELMVVYPLKKKFERRTLSDSVISRCEAEFGIVRA